MCTQYLILIFNINTGCGIMSEIYQRRRCARPRVKALSHTEHLRRYGIQTGTTWVYRYAGCGYIGIADRSAS